MNDKVVQGLQEGHEEDVIVREHGALRRLTLNRPKALNAITLDMSVTMTAMMRAWASDPAVGAVMLDGAGERGFCAGGDIRALYDAAKSGDPLPQQFWAIEYHLNVMIARYKKPVVALMDGVVMGGGIGLAGHAGHRVVTERSAVAMPEVGIGFFPDIGVSFPLARAPGFSGTYLTLTGERMNAADAIYCGLADIHVPTAKLAEIPDALADCRTADEVSRRLGELSTSPAPGKLPAARPWIDACYSADTAEEIFARLGTSKADGAQAALAIMKKASPTSLKITLCNMRDAAKFKRVEECFVQDYRIALACVARHDLIEGIRATIVDKDRNPQWRPPTLEEVTPALVDRHFQSVGALELKFED
jgi:enoyl-CoA hydratase/carnithine racemase